MTHRWKLKITVRLSVFCLSLVFSACATESPLITPVPTLAERMPTMIQLDKPVRFTTPEGASVLVTAGTYDVKPAGATSLQLTPQPGGGQLRGLTPLFSQACSNGYSE